MIILFIISHFVLVFLSISEYFPTSKLFRVIYRHKIVFFISCPNPKYFFPKGESFWCTSFRLKTQWSEKQRSEFKIEC